MGRHWAREKTFQLLFQLALREEDPEAQIELFLDSLNELKDGQSESKEIAAEDLAYIRSVSNGVLAERAMLDEEIQTRLKSWTLERLPKVDSALLRLGAYEIKHLEDVPKSVSINEVVLLAKRYAAEDAHAYINGVLAHFEKPEVTQHD